MDAISLTRIESSLDTRAVSVSVSCLNWRLKFAEGSSRPATWPRSREGVGPSRCAEATGESSSGGRSPLPCGREVIESDPTGVDDASSSD